MFEIKNKVALISGGASGIGLKYAKELLKNGLRGVTLADVNKEFGKIALAEIENEFGKNKAVFVQTDVTSKESYEGAFKRTIQEFQNLDILINNAGILHDKLWEKEVAININGVINGVLLGLETYISKHKSGPEGVIVNISSITGIHAFCSIPVYTATKFAVLGLSLAWGAKPHFDRTKVRVIALCPGVTVTPLITEVSGKNFYEELSESDIGSLPVQSPEVVSAGMVEIIKNAPTATAWVIEAGNKPYEFKLPPRENFQPK